MHECVCVHTLIPMHHMCSCMYGCALVATHCCVLLPSYCFLLSLLSSHPLSLVLHNWVFFLK